jgi:2-polyprenyl-3-methyl-5-hydroxy-6-metoxy-1,4-benzoquinol methylase
MKRKMNKITTAYYADTAPMEAQTSPRYIREIFNKLIKESEKKPNFVLDLGSGVGSNLPTLIKVAKKVYAGDISEMALTESRKRHAVYGNKIVFDICDAQAMKYPDNYFDLVVCTEVLEHVSDLKNTISEIARVVKPHGQVIVTTPNYLNITGIIKKIKDMKVGREYWEPWGCHADGFERHITPFLLFKEFKPCFMVKKYIGIDYAGGWFNYLPYGKAILRILLTPLGYMPFFKRFGLHNVFVLKKIIKK